MIRKERAQGERLAGYIAEQERLNAAAGTLLDFLIDIVNAAARSGDNEYLLAKRLDLILSSKRGEGRALRDAFTQLADFCRSGFISSLEELCPGLTPSERGICAMLSIGMEPVTICKICGYENEQTFYNKRKEIRRKFGLDHAVSLEGYLQDWIDQLERARADRIGHLNART